VRFVPVDITTARRLAQAQEAQINSLHPQDVVWQPAELASPMVLEQGEADKRLVARLSGDTHLLLEIGEPELDLVLRFRAHALMQALESHELNGVIDLTPGIRSLQVHYQPETLSLASLLDVVAGLWQRSARATIWMCLRGSSGCRSPGTIRPAEGYRQIYDHRASDAPWCPSNLEFIRRINDLANIDQVYKTVFDASYLVMGLGDVYLGAPVATPLDPRHRLVTTKYNPARTWTAENSVGIGGAYLCVYGMEGPGGYQFVGRTLQMWNRYHEVADFGGKPWLLRFFDQIRFYPVSADELLTIRRDFPLGRYPLRIEHSTLRLAEYQQFLTDEAEEIAAFRTHQQGAFNAERERWIASGQAHFDSSDVLVDEGDDAPLSPGRKGLKARYPATCGR
jgi:urea carboxylase